MNGESGGSRTADIHRLTGHQCVDCTCYFDRKVIPTVTAREVKKAVSDCRECRSIDPAPPKWSRGNLDVDEKWVRIGMDITHYGGRHFLTLIDCGPSRFSIWRPLRRQDSVSVIEQFEHISFERGPPKEILTDNDSAFRSEPFRSYSEQWDALMSRQVMVLLSAAIVP